MEINEAKSRSRGVQMTINGVERQAASATVTVRAGHSVILSVDVPADVTLTAEQLSEISAAFGPFLEACIAEAADASIPIPLMTTV